jgi:hypothetical protein
MAGVLDAAVGGRAGRVGQVVAFESEGALAPEDNGFSVGVFVDDEQP